MEKAISILVETQHLPGRRFSVPKRNQYRRLNGHQVTLFEVYLVANRLFFAIRETELRTGLPPGQYSGFRLSSD